MSLYDATIVKIDFRAQGIVPGETDAKRLPLYVTVMFHAQERGLPGFDPPMVQYFQVQTLQELRDEAQATWDELERKGAIFLGLGQVLNDRKINLSELDFLSKPASAQHSSIEDEDVPEPIVLDTEQFADTAAAPA
jgi:hypothetical protein